jgi:ferredoxin
MKHAMGSVTFLGMRLADRVKVEFDAGSSLLDIAIRNHIPLPCDCMKGDCGTCAVKVVSLQKDTRMIQLTERERKLLRDARKISNVQYYAEALPDHPPLWRLACEYRPADEKIMVAF